MSNHKETVEKVEESWKPRNVVIVRGSQCLLSGGTEHEDDLIGKTKIQVADDGRLLKKEKGWPEDLEKSRKRHDETSIRIRKDQSAERMKAGKVVRSERFRLSEAERETERTGH